MTRMTRATPALDGCGFIPEHIIFPDGTPEHLKHKPRVRKKGPKQPMRRRVFTVKIFEDEILVYFMEGHDQGRQYHILDGSVQESPPRSFYMRRKDRRIFSVTEITNDPARVDDFFARWEVAKAKAF